MDYQRIIFNASLWKVAALCIIAQISACSTILPPLNQPLSGSPVMKQHKSAPLKEDKRSDDLTLILTFSGGGTRAAAFSYGVMKQLRDTPTNPVLGHGRMLDEVDLISSVSGGSFTAAYYGLHGDGIFRTYEKRFLKRPLQSQLLKYWLLSPSNWMKLVPSLYNRSDLVADYYAANIFGNKTFADLRSDGPQIVINATDLGAGTAFSFTKDNFRWICSELESFPIGRAVVASSAVPVLFSPIALKNYAGGCEPLSYQNKQLSPALLRVDNQALGIRKYKDRNRYHYLHLVDGGVVDNLGIRSLLHLVSEQGNNFWSLMNAYGISKTKKLAFIVVNASDDISRNIALTRDEPDTATTLGAVTTIQSSRYNNDTLDLLESRFKVWQKQVIQGRCGKTHPAGCDDIEFYMAELNFNQLPADLSENLSHVETSLELDSHQVDKLIDAGGMLLQKAPEFQRLLKDLRH